MPPQPLCSKISLSKSVTLHTDLGDIKVELFCEACPKTTENFLALCASDYYNGCLFHRNIKGFMVQTGDPTAQCAGSGLHGKQWAQHKCITVLHHIRQAAPFGPEVHSLWKMATSHHVQPSALCTARVVIQGSLTAWTPWKNSKRCR
ncbi:peptidyl-prolyl cis-trans isomerase-like 3 isoform X28 [Rhipicephalus microplus]|uniref:peptidyl-prolyl cis-trans isomerase-like 3 isoform X28 n=1 Tax=Rhipicephalus microplus TaxID=6941 RepID=UPI003F6B2F7A